jgi:hypothetical protein
MCFAHNSFNLPLCPFIGKAPHWEGISVDVIWRVKYEKRVRKREQMCWRKQKEKKDKER